MQGTAEGAGIIWPGEKGNIIAVFCYQVGFMRWRQTLLGGVQSKDKRHILQQGEILQGTRGKREKNVFPARAVKPWKRLSRIVELPFWEMSKA